MSEINPTAIRDAIVAKLPKDPNIITDTKVHDGLADITVCWRALRWNRAEAIAGRSPEELADYVDENFREWLRARIKGMKDVPKYRRLVAEMMRWLQANPDKKSWLYGEDVTPDPAEAAPPA